MARRIITFFPHNPQPPRTGAHRRFMEVALGLIRLGHEVHFLSSRLVADTPWNDDSVAALLAQGFRGVRVHQPSMGDYLYTGPPWLWYRLRGRPLPIDSRAFCPPGMRQFFQSACDEIKPDVVLMNYAYWDRLVDHARLAGVQRIIEAHDLLTLNFHMRQAIAPWFTAIPVVPSAVPESVLREDFFQELGAVDCAAEYRVYDRYDVTLAISQREARLIQKGALRTHVEFLPMTQEAPAIANEYAGSALMPASNLVFNVHGYVYFVRKVLPRILANQADFVLRLTGTCCERVPPEAGVERAGFVNDMIAEYARSRFMISPVFGGTGQQVKMVEAMAYGLPVVALASAAAQSPIRHGENGLVAENAEEFAEHVGTLWTNRALCRQLGAAARETIVREYSQDRLMRQLGPLLLQQK